MRRRAVQALAEALHAGRVRLEAWDRLNERARSLPGGTVDRGPLGA